MLRELTSHKVNGCNDNIQIVVADGPGQGGACHKYEVINVSEQNLGHDRDQVMASIEFQSGPIAEVGTNGLTHEVLPAILEDRLAGFQSGQYACNENGHALHHVREALRWLKHRTEMRLARGVEGTHQV